MANIIISELRPVGSELFIDSESYMYELTDDELNLAKGGTSVIITTSLMSPIIVYTIRQF